ncbi:hypothetical protein C7D74_32410, partial [Klebsiella pneumoniae]
VRTAKPCFGGVLVGDASDYATLLQMMLNGMALPELSMDRRSAADLQKKIVVSQDGKALLWRRAGGGCQRLCHAAADDAERHGAA